MPDVSEKGSWTSCMSHERLIDNRNYSDTHILLITLEMRVVTDGAAHHVSKVKVLRERR